MKYLVIVFCLVLSVADLSGQVRGKVTDRSTGLPIPFANVFVADKPVGATTDGNGNFDVVLGPVDSILVVSAIGYESQKYRSGTESLSIMLTPATYELPVVTVRPSKHKSQLVIGQYNKNKIHSYFACGGFPWIVTRYFAYRPEYGKTPLIKQLKLLTSASSGDSVIFNLRLLSVNPDGTPGTDIAGRNIIVKAEKGVNKNTTVDLTGYNLTFPETGLIVAVEWLVIDQNKANWKYQLTYLPQFGYQVREGKDNNWIYVGGRWTRSTLTSPGVKNQNKELAAELTLTD
jgi:hypothetical protein